ncbi:hypothetical protein AB751O23_BP_00020 [Chlamydiales bacterium SCGC AB-751-O23]|nr:hypothetical protein AB751O23_BP_00020 [Chlamydiales bacterium SCGC AB-751-O23]
MTYQEAFQKYLDIDPFTADTDELLKLCNKLQISLYDGAKTRDNLLNLLIESAIEPNFNSDKITAFYNYPPHEAALAKIEKDSNGSLVAKRFEIYYKGLELANGYKELTDYQEQEKRLIQAQEKRASLDKVSYPIDKDFIEALKKGLPECCGVAVGFDRLMLLTKEAALINN